MFKIVCRKKMPTSLATLLFFLFMAGCLSVRADDAAMAFLEGIRDYKSKNYEKAIGEFEKIIDTGVRNGDLFYNLGNAYLKSNRTGEAILWYERAFKLIPDDPDLKFNLEYARSFIKDEKPDDLFLIYRVIFFWKHLLGHRSTVWTAVALNFLLWTCLARLAWRRQKILKMPLTVLMFLAAIFICTAFYNYFESAYIREGIVLPSEMSVRSGLSEESTELFVLHAGTKVKIEKELKDYFRIYFSEGKIGWIEKKKIGVTQTVAKTVSKKREENYGG